MMITGFENNLGREKALAAAAAVAGIAIFPNFSVEQRAKGLTDFNDLATLNPEFGCWGATEQLWSAFHNAGHF
jgi:phage/plasmid primase-like uncharacterized protein